MSGRTKQTVQWNVFPKNLHLHHVFLLSSIFLFTSILVDLLHMKSQIWIHKNASFRLSNSKEMTANKCTATFCLCNAVLLARAPGIQVSCAKILREYLKSIWRRKKTLQFGSLNCKVTTLKRIILQDATCCGLQTDGLIPITTVRGSKHRRKLSRPISRKALTVLTVFNVNHKEEGKQRA